MPKMTPEQQAAATKKKLAELYAAGGYKRGETPPSSGAKPAPPAKPSMLENYETLGKKMKVSGERFSSRVSERAMGRKK